jgi:hypothetical protein
MMAHHIHSTTSTPTTMIATSGLTQLEGLNILTTGGYLKKKSGLFALGFIGSHALSFAILCSCSHSRTQGGT